LSQHVCVIPIDSLTGEFVATKLRDHHDINRDLPMGRSYVRQEPRHRFAVSKSDAQFIDELSLSNDPIDGIISRSSGHEGIKSSR
jgi:hypothetical protein